MALIVRECLSCGTKKDRVLFECVTTIADQSCPHCGESDKEKTPRDNEATLINSTGVQVRLPGDTRFLSQPEIEMEMRNKKYWEDNSDRIKSGSLGAVFPKNRPKEFDPSFEKRFH